MIENEYNRSGIYQVPYHPNFRIDDLKNIYVIEDDVIVRKIPLTELKFRYRLKTYYTLELYNLTFYGIRDPFIYDRIDGIYGDSFVANGTVFNRIKGLDQNIFEWYGINNLGMVYSFHRKELRKREIDEDGYVRISWNRPNMSHVAIHRLVYSTWVSEIPEGMVIDHIDNNKWNNHYKNLQCVTSKENSTLAAEDGLYKRNVQLNEEMVRFICDSLSKGHNTWTIINQMGIHKKDDPKLFGRMIEIIGLIISYKINPNIDLPYKEIIDMYKFTTNR